MPSPDARPILVADDDADDLFFARRSLQKAGVTSEIVTCADGREVVTFLEKALREVAANLPRLIFLDVKMPQLDGFQTLKWIREQVGLRSVTVVMLSGSGEPRDTEMARSLGANDYLVKYPPPEVFARIVGATNAPA